MAVQSPPDGFPRITPYLLYEDLDAAVEFLARAFGFEQSVRMPGPDGKLVHAELRLADGVVMAGSPEAEYRNPRRLGGTTALVNVYVDDVDRHHEAAVAAGARIIREPAEQFYGDRTYSAEDPEGHHWTFAQHVRDVAPEDMHP